jgi:peptidoglycan-N-acetylmuramic acid deacetylase
MRPAERSVRTGNGSWLRRRWLGCALLGLSTWAQAVPSASGASAQPAGTDAACARPVYLTFDTGHMGVAPLIMDVLSRQQVKATFFLANERTQPVGERPAGTSLDEHWAPWWAALSRQGHDFGSHTWDHLVYVGDRPGGMAFKPTAGALAGQVQVLSPAQYCEQLQKSAVRFRQMTGQPMRAIFRAPAGRTAPSQLAAARACGWHHVPWSPAGFLGDELPSDRYPNRQLLARALRDVRSGDILLAHLGIWSRQDAWAPAVLEPLIAGLKGRGLCFATLRDHPHYQGVGLAKGP